MTEKKLIGIVVGGMIGLALVLSVVIVMSKNARAAARQKEVAAMAASLGTAVSKSNEFIRNRDYEQAKTTLQAIEPSITTLDDPDLKDQFNTAFGRVMRAEREHKANLKNGWTVFEGEFISPDRKQRLLAERKRQRDKELRQAEHERQLAEARILKDLAERKRREEHERQLAEARRLKEAAESKRREEQRQEEEKRKAEAERKAMQPTSITWVDYRAECGVKAQRENEARSEQKFKKKYRGKRIRWYGQVDSVDTGFLGIDFVITINMSPSDESLISDIRLSVPRNFESLVLSLNEGDFIQFVGIIRSQGGTFLDHGINVEQLAKK